MLRPLPSLIALTLASYGFVVPLHGQATARPVPGAAGATVSSNAPQQADSPIMTLHTTSNLVVIDVVVEDSKQNPVHGLTKESFTLLENGKAQIIKNFEEHSALPPSEAAKIPSGPTLPPGMFTNQTLAPTNGPVNILLLDYLNTPLNAQPFARKQLTEFLNNAPPGTRIAIFALTTGLNMLQGFTSDPEVLKKVLNSPKGAAQASDILTDPVNGGPQGNTELSDNFSTANVDSQSAVQELANIDRFQAIESSFEQELRAKITLGAFDAMARYLVGIPGRKNLIWFSGSFPLNVDPNTDLQDPNDSVVRNDEEVRKTDNLLTRAQVAVYPVDARGVLLDPTNSVVNGPPPGGGGAVSGNQIVPVSSGAATAGAEFAFLQQTAQEHETMFEMADDTGGKAFVNTNNLSQAVEKAVAAGSNYYTVTYSPTNTQWDSRFRALKIKVDQPGVKLTYRKGYYAVDPNDRNSMVAGTAATALVRPTTMSTAMMHGGPDPTQILMRVRVRPAAEPPTEQPIQGNKVNPDTKIGVSGPYKAYGVDVVPDRREINCPLQNGNYLCQMEIATYVYNPAGQVVVTTTERTSAMLSPANYAKMQVQGMAFHQEVSVPVKGQYYLRTAVHDLISDRVGAVEVSIASVAHLQPLDPLPPVAPPAASAPVLVPAAAAPAAVPAPPK